MSLKDSLDSAKARNEIIQAAAAAAYQSICDRIAEEIIYGNGNKPRLRAEGYLDLPDALPLAGGGGEVRLTELRREEIFWGYRKYLSLTRYGAMLVDAVQRQAAKDGVMVSAAVMEEQPGYDRRYVELSQSHGTARCTGRADIACKLALRYRYERTKAGR